MSQAITGGQIAGIIGGGILGSALNGISNAELNYYFQRKLMDRQYKYEIRGLKESPSAQREGLEAAGYNPMIPFFSGGSMGNMAGNVSAPTSNADLGINFDTTKYMELKNLQREQQLSKANIKLMNEQAETEKQQQTELGSRAELNTLMGYKNLSEALYNDGKNSREERIFNHNIDNLISETIKNRLQTELFKSETKYNNEKSRGYSYEMRGPFGMGVSKTGNNMNIYSDQKGEWKEFPNKYGKGTHKEFVYY